MEQALSVNLSQKQILAQRQIESLSILALNAQELTEILSKEQEENPVLEFMPFNPPKSLSLDADDGNWIENIPSPQTGTAADILLSQIDLRNYSQAESDAFRAIADCLNESGYLPVSVREISETARIDIGIVEKCVGIMQSLDPPGVCAFSLSDCLERQLTACGCNDEILFKMVRCCLLDIASGKLNKIARALGITIQNVLAGVEIIRSLNPRPLNGLVGEGERQVIPDIILAHSPDGWEVEVNDRWCGPLVASPYYLKLTEEARKTGDEELRSYCVERVRRIQFLNDAIERRRQTLEKIGLHIARRQWRFLLGTGGLLPLNMEALAHEMDVHPSTVTRAVKGKYVQYPQGVCELRSLFARDAARSAWNETPKGITQLASTRESVKERIRRHIENEDKAKPLSDDRLAELLREEGLGFSRRAVAKYRGELGICGMHDRKIDGLHERVSVG
jgi:RNA polymerase sigma-54 factor